MSKWCLNPVIAPLKNLSNMTVSYAAVAASSLTLTLSVFTSSVLRGFSLPTLDADGSDSSEFHSSTSLTGVRCHPALQETPYLLLFLCLGALTQEGLVQPPSLPGLFAWAPVTQNATLSEVTGHFLVSEALHILFLLLSTYCPLCLLRPLVTFL